MHPNVHCSTVYNSQDNEWVKMCCSVLCQSYLTLCDPMDCSSPGSSVHEILQARILDWVAIPFSRGSFQPRDQTHVSHIADGFFIIWATREAQEYWNGYTILSPGELPNPGINPGSPALQADSLPAELPEKPKDVQRIYNGILLSH